MMLNALLGIGIIGLLAASAFFSGSETGFYRLSRFRLRLGVEQKRPFYATLFSLAKEGRSLMLSILIGNNLANYLLTSVVTVLMFRRLSDQRLAEVYTTALLTPVLFVCGEMIPKILFYHWADTLIPRLTGLLWLSHKGFTAIGAVSAMRWLSDRLGRLFGLGIDTAAAVDATQRHQVVQIIHETREEGLLSRVQREMIERLLQIPNVPVHTVMTPFEKVKKVPLIASGQKLLELLAESEFARRPVCDADGRVVGYIPLYEVLGGEKNLTDIRSFIKPLPELEPACSAIDAMNLLCQKREKIALIANPQTRQPLGIVTLTDLVEELTGELAAS